MPRLRLRLCLALLLPLLQSALLHAQGNFEDADKANDYTDQQFDLRHTIPGEPGVDYPILSEVPKTSFVCQGRHEGRAKFPFAMHSAKLSIPYLLCRLLCGRGESLPSVPHLRPHRTLRSGLWLPLPQWHRLQSAAFRLRLVSQCGLRCLGTFL